MFSKHYTNTLIHSLGNTRMIHNRKITTKADIQFLQQTEGYFITIL